MTFHDSIALRPRFQLYSDASKDKILKQFSNQDDQNTIIRSCVVAPHVFLKITKREQHFWSPQLHLEIFDSDKGYKIHGIFGPNPKLWTFFMFLHFLVAVVFIGCSIWSYVNWTLDQSFLKPIIVMVFMILLWVVLYLFGRVGKQKGKDQMKLLYDYTIYNLQFV